MKVIRLLVIACVSGALSAAMAQSTPQQNQQKPQSAQASQSSATGVSQPPSDDTIRADEDLTNPPPPPAASVATPESPTKPSAEVPAASAPVHAPAPVTRAATPAPVATRSSDPDFPSEVDNTDSGIVTAASSQPSQNQSALQQRDTRNDNKDDNGLVTQIPFNPNDLLPGTNITVRLKEDLSTKDTVAGTPFTATVRFDVNNDNTLVIPAGAELRGRVLHVSQGHHFGLHASLRLHADTIVLPDGTAYQVDADVVESYAPGTSANDEGSVVASNHYTKDAIQYGGAVGTGAAVGAVVGGPVGAGVGSVVGAGAETTHLALQSPQAAELPTGSVLVFSLNSPMHIGTAKN